MLSGAPAMSSRRLLFACGAAILAGQAVAQYKVTAPDGSVTYTDRPPASEANRVTALGRRAPALPDTGSDIAALPFELRQAATRYPVTLYTAANCIPCDNGRQMLQQRGVPYREKQVLNADDSAALDRLTGGRSIPTLTVGSQPLRGYNPNDWASYLNAAGYPADSRLPRGWQPAAPSPLVARAAPAPASQAAPAEAAASPSPAPAPTPPVNPAPGGSSFRF